MRRLGLALIAATAALHAAIALAQPADALPAYSSATDASDVAGSPAVSGSYPAAATGPSGDVVVSDAPPAPQGGYYVPAWVYVPGNYEPLWTARLDLLALQRSSTGRQPLFVGEQYETLLDSQTDLDFPVQVGMDLDLVRKFRGGWELEFGVFSIDWVADNWVPDTSYMVIGDEAIAVDDGVARYRSSLALIDLNVRRHWTENIAVLAGLRFGSLNERYTAWGGHGHDEWSVRSSTDNALFGFQIGTDLKLLTRGAFSIEGMGRAGIYANAIEQRSTLAIDNLEDRLYQTKSHTAFIGEVGLAARYQFTPRFSAKAFYQIAWLEGVALAPEQIAGTDFLTGAASINPHGGLFYHGGGLGLEWRF